MSNIKIEVLSSWDAYLSNFSEIQKDIYFTEEYAKLYEDKESKIECVVCTESDKCALMPFVKRPIPVNLLTGFDNKTYYDMETPYGYGGFISNADIEWTKSAINATVGYLKGKNYVCSFIRFCPLLNNAEYCRDLFTVIDDRKTIAIDTSSDIETIWMQQISSKNRNIIRKAEKNGLVFETDNEFQYFPDFIKLYNSTMKRLSADDFYFFPEDYYARFKNALKEKSFLGVVKLGDEIVASAMFLYTKVYGHYHLAGSNLDGTKLGANNFMLWNVAKKMSELGVKEFHLGGGTDGNPENSLFKFKASFSKNEKQFSIGKLIINQEIYSKVCLNWEKENPELNKEYGNRLLKYRYNQ
jgi:hypothetical protein